MGFYCCFKRLKFIHVFESRCKCFECGTLIVNVSWQLLILQFLLTVKNVDAFSCRRCLHLWATYYNKGLTIDMKICIFQSR